MLMVAITTSNSIKVKAPGTNLQVGNRSLVLLVVTVVCVLCQYASKAKFSNWHSQPPSFHLRAHLPKSSRRLKIQNPGTKETK